jgi:hypothetical protein
MVDHMADMEGVEVEEVVVALDLLPRHLLHQRQLQ